MSYREQAKRLVLQSFDSNSEIGTTIDDRYIFQKTHTLPPPAQDEIANAKVELVHEGILDQRCALTEKGFNLLFPSNKPAMRNKILNHCRENRLRAGDPVMDNAFFHSMLHFNKQQRMDVDKVLADLVMEGFIDKNLCLTESGYRKLY